MRGRILILSTSAVVFTGTITMRFIVNIFGTDYRIANPQTADRGTH